MPAGKIRPVSRRTALTGLLTLIGAGCSRVVFFAANAPAIFGAYKRHTGLAYGDDPRQQLDVYVPDAVTSTPKPLIVFWHGGRWEFGDKADYRFVGAALAESGYVTVIANYRHYPQVKMPGFMDDAARAAHWATAHAGDYGADPGQLFLMGHSAGAHMAALLSLDLRYLRATGNAPAIAGVIGLSGPYDFLPLLESDVQDMFGPPELYPESQPINYVRADAPPMLLVHGLKDETVWPKNSRNLASALAARGASVTLKLYPKLVHADTVGALSAPIRGRAPTLTDIQDFVKSRTAALAAQAALAVAGAANA
jgi:acetyl esterase/lipase